MSGLLIDPRRKDAPKAVGDVVKGLAAGARKVLAMLNLQHPAKRNVVVVVLEEDKDGTRTFVSGDLPPEMVISALRLTLTALEAQATSATRERSLDPPTELSLDQPTDQPKDPPSDESRCPRCGSPKPELHPAVQLGGEVQPCPHDFHKVDPHPQATSEV